MQLTSEKLSVIVKAELKRVPIMNKYLDGLGAVYVERGDSKESRDRIIAEIGAY